MWASVMSIAEVHEQVLGEENDLDENDWCFLHCQCQVRHQIHVLKNIH